MHRTFRTGQGSGGQTTIQLVAAEAINGSVDPKAVFVGTFPNPQSALDGRINAGNADPGTFDNYNPGSNAVHSIDWSNLKFAYLITGGRTYNALEMNVWRNDFSVPLTIEFFNTGVTDPTGSPFKTFSKTVLTDGGGGLDANVLFFDDNVDCTATLGGGNNYWVVLTFGAFVTNPVDIAPHINGTAPNFLEWNGAAWVTPFSSVQRSPGISLFLLPTGGLVYNSKGNDSISSPSASAYDTIMAGRPRFLGFVASNVAQGGVATVIMSGQATFTTPFSGLPANPACIELGTSLGEVVNYDVFSGPPTQLPIGNTYDAQSVIISKNNDASNGFTYVNGQYQ